MEGIHNAERKGGKKKGATRRGGTIGERAGIVVPPGPPEVIQRAPVVLA